MNISTVVSITTCQEEIHLKFIRMYGQILREGATLQCPKLRICHI